MLHAWLKLVQEAVTKLVQEAVGNKLDPDYTISIVSACCSQAQLQHWARLWCLTTLARL